MMKKLFCYILFVILLACGKNDPVCFVLNNLVNDSFSVSGSYYVMVATLDGCSSCMKESFYISDYMKSNNYFLIISDRDKKRVQSAIRRYELDSVNIVFDTLQQCMLNDIIDSKPRLFYMDGNSIHSKFDVEKNFDLSQVLED